MNEICTNMCVGNTFMRSETWVTIHGSLAEVDDDKGLENTMQNGTVFYQLWCSH